MGIQGGRARLRYERTAQRDRSRNVTSAAQLGTHQYGQYAVRERTIRIRPKTNVAHLGNVPLSPMITVAELVAGFGDVYRLFVQRRTSCSPGWPHSAHSTTAALRFVFRPTEVYRAVLNQTLHPRHLRDGVDRSIQLDALSRVLLSEETRPRSDIRQGEQQRWNNLTCL